MLNFIGFGLCFSHSFSAAYLSSVALTSTVPFARPLTTTAPAYKRVVGAKEFASELKDGVTIEADNPSHSQHAEYVSELQSVIDASPAPDTPSVPLSSDIMSDRQWELLNDFVRRILLVLYKERSRVPSDALTHPVRLAEFERTEQLYRAVESNVKSTVTRRAPRVITIQGIEVDYREAVAHDYVICDPMKPTVVLYLNRDEYLKLLAQMTSASITLKVLLGPGEPRQDDQNSPPGGAPHTGSGGRPTHKPSNWKSCLSGRIPLGYIAFLPAWVKPRSWLERLTGVPMPVVFASNSRLVHHATGRRLIIRSYSVLLSVLILAGARPMLRKSSMVMLSSFYELVANQGLAQACALYKESRRVLYKYLNGTPVFDSELALGITKSGLPRTIPSSIRTLIRANSVTAIRIALFILDIGKLYEYEARGNIDPIIQPASPIDPALIQRIRGFVPVFRKMLESELKVPILQPNDLRVKRFNFTTKAGPNGPALLTSFLDALALHSHASFFPFESYCKLIGENRILAHLVTLSGITRTIIGYLGVSVLGRLNVGKISTTPNPYGKVRIFAIPTYWVQVIMYPVHEALFKVLRVIPTDYTFDQGLAIKHIIDSQARCIYSYDLSAATDRFPLEIQEIILPSIFAEASHEFAVKAFSLWADILRTTEFTYTDRFVPSTKGAEHRIKGEVAKLRHLADRYIKYFRDTDVGDLSSCIVRGSLRNQVISKTSYLRYAAGQPMGTYSSWAAFTLCHHFIVQLAAHEVAQYQNWYRGYSILGDDVVLYSIDTYGSHIALRYKDLMSGLGVDVNPNKGLESSNGTFEFAKRFVSDGVDLSVYHWKEIFFIRNASMFHDYLKYKLMPLVDKLHFGELVHAFLGLLPSLTVPTRARLSIAIDSNRWQDALKECHQLRKFVTLALSPFGVMPTLLHIWVSYLQSGIIHVLNKDNDITVKPEGIPSFEEYYKENTNTRVLLYPLFWLLFKQFFSQIISGLSNTFTPGEFTQFFDSGGLYGRPLVDSKGRTLPTAKYSTATRSYLLTPDAIKVLFGIMVHWHPFQWINRRASLLAFLSVKPSPGSRLAAQLSGMLQSLDGLTAHAVKMFDTLNRLSVGLAGEAIAQRGILASNTFCSFLPSAFVYYKHYPSKGTASDIDISLVRPDAELLAADAMAMGGSLAYVAPDQERLRSSDESSRILAWAEAISSLDNYIQLASSILGMIDRVCDLLGLLNTAGSNFATVRRPHCPRLQPARVVSPPPGAPPAPILVSRAPLPSVGVLDSQYATDVSTRQFSLPWGEKSILPVWSYSDAIRQQLDVQAVVLKATEYPTLLAAKRHERRGPQARGPVIRRNLRLRRPK